MATIEEQMAALQKTLPNTRRQGGSFGEGLGISGINVETPDVVNTRLRTGIDQGGKRVDLPATTGMRPLIDVRDRQRQLVNIENDAFNADLAAGRQRGQELFGFGQNLNQMGGGALQQLQQASLGQGTLQGLGDIASGGFQAPGLAGIRSAALTNMQSQEANNLRALQAQQGASGVRGAAAQAGVLRSGQQSDQARQQLEGGLAAQDIGLRSQATQQLAQGRMGALQSLQNTINRERLGQLNTEFGQAGLGQASRSGALQNSFAERERLNQEQFARSQGVL